MPIESQPAGVDDRASAAPSRSDERRPRYWIKTYGCQMNVHDSEVYAGLLTDMGYEAAERPEDADVVLVNTCSVRERAEDKLFSQLGVLRQLKQDIAAGEAGPARELKIGVTGCIAQQRGAGIIDRESTVDFVIGTRAIQSLPKVLQDVNCGKGSQVITDDLVEFEAPGAQRGDRVKAFVTIMEGCNNYCSFCIVPATRGFEIYRSGQAILDEVRGLGLRGYREVTLLGQNVNSWRDPDTGMDFPGLLTSLDRMLRREPADASVRRIRFLTSHPKDLSPRLIEAMGDCERIAKHLHLPVQSGSDRILHQMNRHYTADKYRRQVEALRRRVPDVGLSTDLIVGFPGETVEDYEATLSLVREIEYDSFFSFEYSPRPGTTALRYEDDVSAEDKRARLIELQRVGAQIQERHNAAFVGKETIVLVEGMSKRSERDVTGRTSSNHIVNLPGDANMIGREVRVRITGHGGHSLQGEPARALSGRSA